MPNVRFNRVARILAAVAATASLALGPTACATSSRARGSVAGIFDEGADHDADGIPDSVDRAPEGGEATIAADESEPTRAIGFTGGVVSGRLKKLSADVRPESQRQAPAAPPPPAKAEVKPEPTTTTAATGATSETSEEPKQAEASGPRLVIYKGTLSVLVPTVDAAVEKLSARAKELGGYVENQTANASANNATVTMRIPAEKFYDVVNELGSYGQVTEKQINAEDVTKRVFDVELRLDTAEKSRERLLDLLKSAAKTEDVLHIENEIRRLTDEIEGMKGELRFLHDQVAMSTLTVSFWSNAPPPTSTHARVRSRFDWINRVGIEAVLSGF